MDSLTKIEKDIIKTLIINYNMGLIETRSEYRIDKSDLDSIMKKLSVE